MLIPAYHVSHKTPVGKSNLLRSLTVVSVVLYDVSEKVLKLVFSILRKVNATDDVLKSALIWDEFKNKVLSWHDLTLSLYVIFCLFFCGSSHNYAFSCDGCDF